MIRLTPEDAQSPQVEVHAQQDVMSARWSVTISVLSPGGLPGAFTTGDMAYRHQLDQTINLLLGNLGYTEAEKRSLRGRVIIKPARRGKNKRMGET